MDSGTDPSGTNSAAIQPAMLSSGFSAASTEPESVVGRRQRDVYNDEEDDDDDEYYDYARQNGTNSQGENDTSSSEIDDEDSLFLPEATPEEMIPQQCVNRPEYDVDESEESAVDESNRDEVLPIDVVDDDDDEEEQQEEGYSELREHFPHCAAYDNRLPKVVSDLHALKSSIIAHLQRDDLNTPEIANHIKVAKGLRIEPAKRPRIALLGFAGKSALLNSVTDLPELVRSVANGKSCTCVLTEYQAAFPNQQKRFAARIQYYSFRQIRHVLRKYIESYQMFTFEFNRNWEEEVRQSLRQASQTAMETLMTLFRDLPEFSNEKSAKAFLKKDYDGNVKALDVLLQSCEKKLKGKITVDQGYCDFFQGDTLANLRRMIDPLMTSRENSTKPNLWPLVREVIFGVGGTKLLDRMTFVDLPGISDENKTRVEHSLRKMKSCDEIWIVASVGRVADDAMVMTMLERYGKIFKGRIVVVGTHSDQNADSQLLRDLEEEGHDMSKYKSALKKQNTVVSNLNSLKPQLRAMDRIRNPSPEDIDKRKALQKELSRLKKHLEASNSATFAALVNIRNQGIIQRLQRTASERGYLPDGRQLRVFCVSNTHYQARIAGKKVDGSKLFAQDTGIPALRAYALAMVAPEIFQAVEDFAKGSVHALLKNIIIWVNGIPAARHLEYMKAFRGPLNTFDQIIDQCETECNEAVNESVNQPFLQQSHDFVLAAKDALNERNSKHSATKRAFIRKYGNYKTSLCPKDVWNEQIPLLASTVLCELLANYETETMPIITDLRNKLVKSLRDIPLALQAMQTEPSAARFDIIRAKHLTANINELVESQVIMIDAFFRRSQVDYQLSNRAIIQDVTLDSETNPFSRNMAAVYEDCMSDSGKGVTKRSMTKILDRVCQPGSSSPITAMRVSSTATLKRNNQKLLPGAPKGGPGSIRGDMVKVKNVVYASLERMVESENKDPRDEALRKSFEKIMPVLDDRYARTIETLNVIKTNYRDTGLEHTSF